MIQDAKEMGVKQFLFTGSEPLLNPITLPVAQYAKALGIRVELISNGLLINESNVQEIASTFDYISISLDSMKPETHEQMRGKGTFDKVVQAIRLLKAKGG